MNQALTNLERAKQGFACCLDSQVHSSLFRFMIVLFLVRVPQFYMWKFQNELWIFFFCFTLSETILLTKPQERSYRIREAFWLEKVWKLKCLFLLLKT